MNDRSRTRGGPAGNYLDPASVSPVLNTTLELAATAAGYPVALLHILDDENQHVLAAYGIEGLVGAVTNRQSTTCKEVVDTGRPLVITDASEPGLDPSLTAPLVAAGMRTYVGVPLFSREHTAIGTLCMTDTVGHDIGPEDVQILQKYAKVLEEQLELQRDRTVTTDAYSIEEIVDAMSRDEIRPWFQAIVDPRTRRTHGYEALCRWLHPTDGVLSPARFLPTVRSTDIMLDLDLQVLRQAMAMMLEHDTADEQTVLHANIDGAHLIRPQRIEMLTSVISESDFPTDRLRIELIESATLDDSVAAQAISKLRAIGAQIVIDDVGRGWSSLSRMVTWPIDGFKIDASLTSGLGTRVVDHLLTGLIEHADANDLVVIAEGIETPEQVRSLVALQCPLAQGYHFQVPQPDPRPA
ncbi:sensor domain-containing phosphodiesterase [Williamsia maris]|uniref:EAL domain, c-di-GMP-specific phosphodiesterase class I (Or its enzymatically inactive variant) n=1 Tax=Williamsia maris TaxID=72806 RepID=A0ABT1HA76_9NOCA|nr:EAL domain-containing protein [Williamsia maris]MCP2175162.1 EAL domain, c-di-GMP-specific phosphodiesterase class I (or its enzymatically inactive variant) [Williamsia maris]